MCSPSAGLNSKSIASSDPSSLLSLMLSTSHQKSSMEVLSMEACELERLKAGGTDSLESILLILRQRERDFLKRESNTNKIIFLSCWLVPCKWSKQCPVTLSGSREEDFRSQVHSSGNCHGLCCSQQLWLDMYFASSNLSL